MNAAIIAIMLATAGAADTFDLLCAGQVSTESIAENKTESYSHRYRVDLASGQWCEGDCSEINLIAKVNPGSIVFENVDKDAPSERVRQINNVSRETGQHLALYTYRSSAGPMSILTIRWRGICERADFSGFPKGGAKF